MGKPLRPYAGNVEANGVQTSSGGHIKGLCVAVTPIQIRWHFWGANDSQLPSVRRDDPDSVWSGAVHVPFRVDFHPVGYTFYASFGQVGEYLGIGQRSIW